MKTNALAVFLSVLLILPNAAMLSARAAESDIEVRVDGVVLETDAPPAIIDGRTMVPMRAIFEKLGAAIAWEPDAKKVSAEKDGTKIELVIGALTAKVNGADVSLDVPAVISESRTLVPLRFISESLGLTVDWDATRRSARVWSMSEELLNAVKRYDEMYEKDTLAWLASLYDPEIGGFYYSRSARDNEGFFPDIESTTQSIDILNGSGILRNGVLDSSVIPDEIRIKILEFLQSRQDEGDGYFYDIGFGKNVGNSKRERNLGQAQEKIWKLGGEAKYLYPADRINAEKKKAADSASTLPDYLQSEETCMKWLRELPWETKPYWSANQAIASYSTANKLGYGNAMREYIKSIQNTETGLWGTGLNYEAVNAAMKVSGFFSASTEPYPYIDKMIKSVIWVVENEGEPAVITDVWNPLVVISAGRASYTNFDPELKREIEASMVKMIDITIANTKKFKHADGGYSYGIKLSSPTSQGAPVSLGLAEGDVNATTIATQAMRNSTYKCLGVYSFPPFWDMEKDYFWDLISKQTKPVKAPYNPLVYEQDFENFKIGATPSGSEWVLDDGALLSVEKDPSNMKNKALCYSTEKGASAKAVHTFKAAKKKTIAVEFDFLVEQDSSNPLFYGTVGSTPAVGWVIEPVGSTFNLNCRTSGKGFGSTIKSGLEKDEWYRFKIVYTPDGIENTKVKYYINDELCKETNEYYNGGNPEALPGTSVDRLGFFGFLDGSGSLFIDNIKITSADDLENK